MIVLVWDGQRLFMQMYLLIKREIIFNVVCMLLNDGKNYAVLDGVPTRSLSLAYLISWLELTDLL